MRKLLILASFIGLFVVLLNTIFKPVPDEIITTYSDLKPGSSIPLQIAPGNTNPIRIDDYIITPLAEFDITARVLSRKTYHFGREADLSPVDLALGWGRMSDPDVLDQISIRQSNRWYYWSVPEYPIPRREIETYSANMHLIPANDLIEEHLDDIDEGQNIRLKGQLVRVEANDGWRWVSSLNREDTGARACELIYVTDVFLP